MKTDWQVQEAKAELSAVIQAAQRAPQVITRRGEPVAVMLSIAKYKELSASENRPTLFDFLRTWPEVEIPERDKYDFGRDVTL